MKTPYLIRKWKLKKVTEVKNKIDPKQKCNS